MAILESSVMAKAAILGIAATAVGGGIWVGAIDNKVETVEVEQKEQGEKYEKDHDVIVRMELEQRHLNDEVDALVEGQKEILKELRK